LISEIPGAPEPKQREIQAMGEVERKYSAQIQRTLKDVFGHDRWVGTTFL